MKRVYRKTSYPLDEIRRFLEPGPIVLVSSTWRGIPNVMTMGWHMMLGFKPALNPHCLAVGLARAHQGRPGRPVRRARALLPGQYRYWHP